MKKTIIALFLLTSLGCNSRSGKQKETQSQPPKDTIVQYNPTLEEGKQAYQMQMFLESNSFLYDTSKLDFCIIYYDNSVGRGEQYKVVKSYKNSAVAIHKIIDPVSARQDRELMDKHVTIATSRIIDQDTALFVKKEMEKIIKLTHAPQHKKGSGDKTMWVLFYNQGTEYEFNLENLPYDEYGKMDMFFRSRFNFLE